MPEISRQQAEALGALAWLLSEDPEDRRSGRSMMIALAFLRMAVGQPGTRWIYVFDHFADPNGVPVVMEYVQQIARDAGLHIVMDRQQRSFRCPNGVLTSAIQYLFDQFVESDVEFGLTPEQLEQQAQRAGSPPRPARPPHGTTRDALLKYVYEHPGLSATQIAHALDIKASTASSYLYTASQEGKLVRKSNGGPRSGMTYFPPEPEVKVVGPSVYERLKSNPYG